MRKLLSILMILVFLTNSGLAETLILPAGLREIEDEAFAGDMSISEVVLPDGLEKIGSRAFADTDLHVVTLPSSLTDIAPDAFEGDDMWWFDAEGYMETADINKETEKRLPFPY